MTFHAPGRPVEILLVEDNPADVRLTQEGLREAKIHNNLHTVMDGKQALDFLFRRGEHANAPTPDLVLLDLNLPGVDGRAVLKAIKDDPKLRVVPVIVVTSSEAEADILRSYEAHANCFVSKPIGFEQFIHVIQSIESFWFSIVKLPPASAGG